MVELKKLHHIIAYDGVVVHLLFSISELASEEMVRAYPELRQRPEDPRLSMMARLQPEVVRADIERSLPMLSHPMTPQNVERG